MKTVTLQSLFEQYKEARAFAAEARLARVDADERAAAAKASHQAAMTAEDNAKAVMDGFIKGQTEPPEQPRGGLAK